MKKDFVIVVNDAFPFGINILKLYPLKNVTIEQLIYNYMLSRSRHAVEITSRILLVRFHFFLGTILFSPGTAGKREVVCYITIYQRNPLKVAHP